MTVSNERPRRRAAEPIRAPRDEDARHHLSPLDGIVKLADIGTIFGNFLCESRAPACLDGSRTRPMMKDIAQTSARLTQQADYIRSLLDVRLDKLGEVLQRFLPAEIARLHWNRIRQTFLHNGQLGAHQHWPERDRYLNLSRQIGIIEAVRVAQPFIWHQLDVFALERMTLARGE